MEIKLEKTPTHDECMKCCVLAQQSGKNVYLFYQAIGTRDMNGYVYMKNSGSFLPLHRFTQCPKCRGFDITYQGRVVGMNCGCCDDCVDLMNDNSFDIQNAVKTVRSERFGA